MDRTRVISSAAIWTAAAVMFVGGFARMSWSGLGGVYLVLGVVALFVVVDSATKWVWTSEKCAEGQVPDRDDA